MRNDPYQQKVDALKQLLAAFRFERTVYLSITTISLVVLLICAAALVLRKSANPADLIGLFGSSGGIAYSTGRLLKMWSEAVRVLYPTLDKQK
jgi:hypothetical protein